VGIGALILHTGLRAPGANDVFALRKRRSPGFVITGGS